MSERLATSLPLRSSRFAAAAALMVITQNDSVYLIPREANPLRLNLTASFAWTRLCGGVPFGDVCAEYARRFNVADEIAWDEVASFARSMCNAGYLVRRRRRLALRSGAPAR